MATQFIDRVHLPVRFAVCLLLVAAGISTRGVGQDRPAPPLSSAGFAEAVRPFLAKHCESCHGEKKQAGDVRLDGLRDVQTVGKSAALLEKVQAVLRKRVMPPKKQSQPSEAEVAAIADWLDGYLDHLDRTAPPNPGKVTVRRLNRTEYNNTVRDLFGVRAWPADDFPQDDTGYGFDTIGDVLTVSPVLTEKYLSAAEKVARTAVFGPEPLKPSQYVHQPWYIDFSKNRAAKTEYDETGMSLPGAVHVVHRFPVDGEYDLRGFLRGFRPVGSDPVELGFWIDGKLVKELKVPVPARPVAGELNGLWAEFRTPVAAGEHWLSVTILRMYEGLPASYNGPKPTTNPAARGGKAADEYFVSNLAVSGPYNQKMGPAEESRRKIFVAEPSDPDRARKIVANLARRAYRRPPTAAEVNELVRLVETVQKEGDSFEEGVCVAIQRVLISPHFLFRVERTPTDAKPGEPYPIGQHELATRLSYFLWSSTPDDELLAAADKQSLGNPEVVEAQVKQMLADPRSRALAENFAGQWLQTRALESHTPDRTKFQEFTEYTRMSMRKETELFFEYVVKEDRPVVDFLTADYTFLNQRLAEFYKIPGVKGHEFRKVSLTGTNRGGVWTHAGVLAVSSYANRTSPVLRGKWILENLLNAPPPPPPPTLDIPDLDDDGAGAKLPLRQRLEQHRANAACASCHSRMDPLGFGLENFDPIGMWREKEGTFPIDAAGTLPDGRSFTGPAGLRNVLKAETPAFVGCLADKLLTYALGRGLERYDRAAVKGVVRVAAERDNKFSAVVLGVVNSPPFRTQKVVAKED